MALEVALGSIAGALVALVFLGGLAWAWWRATRRGDSWPRRLVGYVGSGALGLLALSMAALMLGSPAPVAGVVSGASVAALAVVGVTGSIMDAFDRKAERDQLMSVGAPVPDQRISPLATGGGVFVLVGLVGGVAVEMLFILGKALSEPQQTGSALQYQQQLVATVISWAVVVGMGTAWAALIGGVVAYVVQRWRVQDAKARFALAQERFEARLERERTSAAAPILQNT